MLDETISKCNTLIRSKYVSKGKRDDWDDDMRDLYTLVLEPLPDDIGYQAVQDLVLTQEWPPDVSAIRRRAAELASPLPSADEAYAELMWYAENVGENAMPHPDRPSILLPGPPVFSHPIIDQAVGFVGGYRAVCNGEANLAEGVSKQFKRAFERVIAEWHENVARALALPADRRPKGLFPPYRKFEQPAPRRLRSTEAIAPASPMLGSMPAPEDVKRALDQLIGREWNA